VFVPTDKPCPSCGQQRELAYIGPFYSTEEVHGLCPMCVADGSAAEKWDMTFVDPSGPEPLDDEEKLDELLRRTPGYFSAQGDPWPVHCDDYCAVVARVSWADIADRTEELEADLDRLEAHLGLSREELIAELSRESPPLWAELFRCLTCGTHRLTADFE
jgi:uncharacterized protein CbrC (UPF0167 family)